MKRTEHAQEIANRFRDLVENAGDSLPASHYDELSLLIEAGIDTALVELMEGVGQRLETMAQEIKNAAENFE